MESYKREFIKFLEGAGVLKFGDFTAKSGRKIPYFINAGDIKTGDQICKLGEFYAKAYFEKVGNKRTVLYGPAYKGIPIAVSVATALSREGLDVPFFFNRKEEKDHGEGGVFVGYKPQAGEEIVIVEKEDGSFMVAGASNSSSRDLKGITTRGGNDVVIASFSKLGELSWTRSFGGTKNESANAICLATDGGYVIAGRTLSTDIDMKGIAQYVNDKSVGVIVKFPE